MTGDLLEIAAADRKDPAAATAPDRGFVVLASVKDVAAATDWVAKEAGGTASTATYGDGTITTVDRGGMTLAWATRGTVLLLGPEVTVKAALDTNGASPIAASSAFVAAKSAAPGAYLGFGYLDTADLAAGPRLDGRQPDRRSRGVPGQRDGGRPGMVGRVRARHGWRRS